MKLFTCGIVKRKIDFYTHAHTHSLSLSHTHARAHSLSLTHIHTPSYTHAYPHSRTLTQSFKVSSISHSQCPPHSLSLLRSLSHFHTHTHTHPTRTHSLSLLLIIFHSLQSKKNSYPSGFWEISVQFVGDGKRREGLTRSSKT